MSIACRECGQTGSFNTLIIFSGDGVFDPEKPLSHYFNFYTDCATPDDFEAVETSRFAIVQEKSSQDSFFTGSDGDKLSETTYKLIDETSLAKKLPKTFAAFGQSPPA